MRRLRYLTAAWVVLGLTYACSSDDKSGDANGDVVDPACADETDPPSTLACTGLYASKSTALSADVRAYAPAVPLWSDGAEKSRWIKLPAGTTIDATNPAEWKFPVGTKAWKEFRVGGRRVETRLWQKTDTTVWVNATYAWNEDQTSAVLSKGGDIQLPGGGKYHIPTNTECQQCHRGRTDRLLGFEGPSLGQDGASGWTLSDLVAENRITPAPGNTHLTIGDDGTGKAAAAMGWIHVNCGVTCHNTNSSSIGYAAGMNFRLDATELDGRPSNDFGIRKTSIGQTVVTPQWAGATRIIPGDPDNSLLYQLISRREDNNQMPPIATSVVDTANVENVRAWIAAMGSPPPPADAGTDSGTPEVDAGSDSGTADAGVDAGSDSGTADAGVDAGDAGDAGGRDGGSLCQAGSIAEAEPNDSVATENRLPSASSTFCGRIAAGDLDYVTFTLPPSSPTFSFAIHYTTKGAAAVIDGSIDDGTTFTLDGSNPPVKPGRTYTLAISASAAADYELAIDITP